MATQAKNKNNRNKRKKRPDRQHGLISIIKWCCILALVGGAIFVVTIAAMFWMYNSDPALPNISKISEYRPKQVSRVLSSEGEIIGEIFDDDGRRTVIQYKDIPTLVINAFVSAEDASFWKHKGIDYKGLLRAVIVNVKEGKKSQGASTITQQVVRNLLLTRKKSFKRKFQEIILARRLEKSLSKEDIMTLYANEIYLGENRYGIVEAARYYFGKSVSDLNPGEAAVLASLPKAPNRYSPKKTKNHERLKDRQTYVLNEMVKEGYLEKSVAKEWVDKPIEVVANPFPTLGVAPEWVVLAKEELKSHFGEDEMFLAGGDVVTTVSVKAQTVARAALRLGLIDYDKRKGYGWPLRSVAPDKIKLEKARLKKKYPKNGVKKGEDVLGIVARIKSDNNEMLVELGAKLVVVLVDPLDSRLSIKHGKLDDRFKPGDFVHVTPGEAEGVKNSKTLGDDVWQLSKGPEGAVVVLDPKTRKLRAVVGGFDQKVGDYNRATDARRQAGSTFKVFVYATAIASREYSPATIVNDAPEVYELWKPENYSHNFVGPVSLRHALAKSINTVSIRVTHDMSSTRVINTAKKMGIESPLADDLSMALGSGAVTPLELSNAFATFAVAGKLGRVQTIEKVAGSVFPASVTNEVISPQVAYILVDMMRSVVRQGTGSKASVLKMDIGGKTGTSNDARDAWFMGMTQDLVVGVWVGFDSFSKRLGSKEGGSYTALPIFIDVMAQLGNKDSRFIKPGGLSTLMIDPASGLLDPEKVHEKTYAEVFLPGTAPKDIAPSPGDVVEDSAIMDQYMMEDSVEPKGVEPL